VGKRIHAIVDNYAAHKHPNVRRWLGRHPRWPFHFTPISASWLNAVERFFATLDRHLLILGVALLGRGNQRASTICPPIAM
jgi:transposase